MLIKDPTARPTMNEVEMRLQQLAAQQQLAKTMMPPPRSASPPAPAMVPNANVTVQLRSPPPAVARPPWQWAVMVGLAVVGLIGLWVLLGVLLGPQSSTVGEPVREAPGPVSHLVPRAAPSRPPA